MDWPAQMQYYVGGIPVDPAVVFLFSALAALAVLGFGVVAYRISGSRVYVFVAIAVAAVFARPLASGLAATSLVPASARGIVEQGYDTLIIVLVLGAGYYARFVAKRLDDQER